MSSDVDKASDPASGARGARGEMARFLGAGSLYTIATVAPILTLLAVTPVVSRILGAGAFGEVAVAVSIYQFSSVILGLGLPAAITRNALIEGGGFRAAGGLVLAGSGLAVVLAALAAVSAPLWSPAAFPAIPVDAVQYALAAGAGLAIVTLAQGVFRAAERVWTFVAIGGAAAIVPPLAGVIVLLAWNASPSAYLAALAAAYLLVGLVSVVVVMRQERPGLSAGELRSGLAIAVPTVPHLVSVPLILTISLSIVLQNEGVAQAGRLQLAAMLGTAAVTVLNAMNNAWSPMILKAPSIERESVLARSTHVVALAAFVLVSGYGIIAPYAVALVGGPVADDSLPAQASMMITAGSLFLVLYLANIHLTFLSGRTLPLALTTPLSLVIAVLVLWALVTFLPADGSLVVYGIAWPLFYVFQALFAYLLARGSGYPPARVRRALLPLGLGVLVCVQGSILPGQPLTTMAVVAVFAAILLVLLLRQRRRSA